MVGMIACKWWSSAWSIEEAKDDFCTNNNHVSIQKSKKPEQISGKWWGTDGPQARRLPQQSISFILMISSRLEICRDRHDRRSCKNFSSCVNFSRKQCVSLKNLRTNVKFPHEYGKFTHLFSKIIEIEIDPAFFLIKLVVIYAFLVCKFFGLKIWSCKIVDKFQVWMDRMKCLRIIHIRLQESQMKYMHF